MTINSYTQAMDAALKQTRNTPGTCQLSTRGWYNAPSVGDVDGDGDSDAVDGWESEPPQYRHPGDRNPPAGVPLAFHGGSKGQGHRCIRLYHDGRLRSTDMLNNHYSAGHTSTVYAPTTSDAIAIIEHSMNVIYTGWTETIDGHRIPKLPMTRGKRIDASIQRLRRALAHAKPNTVRRAMLIRAIKALMKIPQHPKK